MDFMQFLDMILHVDKSLGSLIQEYGTLIYMVLFLIVFCETGLVVLPFLPGDTLLFIGGAFCASVCCVLPLTRRKSKRDWMRWAIWWARRFCAPNFASN